MSIYSPNGCTGSATKSGWCGTHDMPWPRYQRSCDGCWARYPAARPGRTPEPVAPEPEPEPIGWVARAMARILPPRATGGVPS